MGRCGAGLQTGAWSYSYRENKVLSWGYGGTEGPRSLGVSTYLSQAHIHFHAAIPPGSQVLATIISGLKDYGSLFTGLPFCTPLRNSPFPIKEQKEGVFKTSRSDHTPLAKTLQWHPPTFSTKITFDFLTWHSRPLAINTHSHYV